MSIEERLRAALRRRAGTVEPAPDWGDLDDRLRRSARRRGRALAGALALVLVVGPAAGFAIGRAVAGSDDEPSIAATAIPRDLAPSAPGVLGEGGSPLPPNVPIGLPNGGELDRLFLRTTGDGVELRAYRVTDGVPTFCSGPDCAPAECYPNVMIALGLSNEGAVDEPSVGYYEDALVPILTTSGFFGLYEKSPAAYAFVQVGPDVARVRVRFAEGAVDEMEPVDGVALLAHMVTVTDDAEPFVYGSAAGTVEALDDDGNVVATKELGTNAVDEVLALPECAPVPPPTLEPNGPPPENVDEARQAVVDAFTVMYTAAPSDEKRATFVDDPTGLVEAWARARENFPQALEVLTVNVDEVVFLNPTEATVRFDILLPGYSIPEFPDELGSAVLVDGQWKVKRDTVCSTLGLAAVRCEP